MNDKPTPVAISRYSDATFIQKEYIVDDQGRIRCFINIASAKDFLIKVFGTQEDQLDWFMYDPVTVCDECSGLELDTSKTYVTDTKTICENCYYSPD